jgi:hypothetical protein
VLEQTVWIAPRATSLAEFCEACAEELLVDPASADAVVVAHLPPEDDRGWATCNRGHTLRVLRMGSAMPAGALR